MLISFANRAGNSLIVHLVSQKKINRNNITWAGKLHLSPFPVFAVNKSCSPLLLSLISGVSQPRSHTRGMSYILQLKAKEMGRGFLQGRCNVGRRYVWLGGDRRGWSHSPQLEAHHWCPRDIIPPCSFSLGDRGSGTSLWRVRSYLGSPR